MKHGSDVSIGAQLETLRKWCSFFLNYMLHFKDNAIIILTDILPLSFLYGFVSRVKVSCAIDLCVCQCTL